MTTVEPRAALDRLTGNRLKEIGLARAALPSLLAERSAGETTELVDRIEIAPPRSYPSNRAARPPERCS